jgi:predicted ArsR family transcriptional regulator
MTHPNTRYSVKEAAALTGLTEKAIRRRLDRGTLDATYETQGGGGRMVRMVTRQALARAGLLGEGRVDRSDKQVRWLIAYLKRRPGQPLNTHVLAKQSGLPRQACQTALTTLRALDLVQKSEESPPDGRGRPRVTWRWKDETR